MKSVNHVTIPHSPVTIVEINAFTLPMPH